MRTVRDPQGLEDFTTFLRGFDETFPDNVQTLSKLVADEDHVAVWSRTPVRIAAPSARCRHRGAEPTSSSPESSGWPTFKVAEWWVTWENRGILGHLGALA